MISILILAAALCLSGCAGTERSAAGPSQAVEENIREQAAEGKELIAVTETREKAEEIAEQYGIELVEWSSAVACFHTEEDPWTVIRRGEERGWPPLEINHIITAQEVPT